MKTQFITGSKGRKIAVVLPVKKYKKILEDLKELEDIRLYDQTKATKGESIPANAAFKMIDAKRKKKSWATK
jgi:hypothetical protein